MTTPEFNNNPNAVREFSSGPAVITVGSTGRVFIPEGSIWDFASPNAVIKFKSNLFDLLEDGNIVQSAIDFTPNTVTDSQFVTVLAGYGNTADGMNNGVVLASRGCDASGPGLASATLDWYVIGSGACDHNIAGTGIQMGFLGAANSSFITVAPTTPATTNRVGNVGIEHSNLCTIDTSGSNPFGFNGNIRRSFIKGCDTCNIRSFTATICTRNSIQSSAGCNIDSSFTTNIIGSNSSTATGCSTASMLVANSGTATNCSICLLGGSTPSASGVTNCFVWGTASPTASNQAVFGTDVLVRNNRDITTDSGYMDSAQGHVTNYREILTGSSSLGVTDGTIKLSPGTTLSLPSATTMAANFPVGRSRTWKIISDSVTSGVPTPPTMTTTGADRLNNKPQWSSHIFKATGQRMNISLVNTVGVARWYITDDIEYNSYVYTDIDNNFGTPAPKANASLLPVSANKAAHDVLGNTSYAVFSANAQNSANLVTVPGPQGFNVNLEAALDITYQFEIFFATAGVGNYIIRADMINTTTNQIVPGSYIEISGANGPTGYRAISRSCRGTVNVGINTYQLRISQDTVNQITTDGNIRFIKVNVKAAV